MVTPMSNSAGPRSPAIMARNAFRPGLLNKVRQEGNSQLMATVIVGVGFNNQTAGTPHAPQVVPSNLVLKRPRLVDSYLCASKVPCERPRRSERLDLHYGLSSQTVPHRGTPNESIGPQESESFPRLVFLPYKLLAFTNESG